MDFDQNPVRAAPVAESIDAATFREVLGHFPTGVVVITGITPEGAPLGMTVGSFTSVSLDPPLVAFLPEKKSRSWAYLRASGPRFSVNVLAHHQDELSASVALRETEKFAGFDWRLSPTGLPVVSGCVAYIDCTTEQIVEAGDHHIVIGRVDHLAVEAGGDPLVFHAGAYGTVLRHLPK